MLQAMTAEQPNISSCAAQHKGRFACQAYDGQYSVGEYSDSGLPVHVLICP